MVSAAWCFADMTRCRIAGGALHIVRRDVALRRERPDNAAGRSRSDGPHRYAVVAAGLKP